MATLTANLTHGGTGKACIGRVTGPDPKWGLALEWLGTSRHTSRSGRTGSVSAEVTAPGVYVEIDDDRETRRHVALIVVDGDVYRHQITEALAQELAKEIAAGRSIADLESHVRDDGKRRLRGPDGQLHWRSTGDARAEALATIRALMAEHGITAEDLR